MIKKSFLMIIVLGVTLGIPGLVQPQRTASAAPLIVGYYTHTGEGMEWQAPPIIAAGHTPVNVFTPDAATLAGVDILVVDGNRTSPQGEWQNNLAAIDAAVAAGLILVYTDWFPETANDNVPGAGGIVFCQYCGDDGDINITNPVSPVTRGPAGRITDTNLDQGNSSHHGYADLNTLPAGAEHILSSTRPNEIVLFSYPYQAGHVIYATIPLGCYLADVCLDPPRTTMNTTLAPNMITYAVSLAQGGLPPVAANVGPLRVGYYSHRAGEGQEWQTPPITAGGHTPVQVITLDAVTLAGLDILVVDGEWSLPSPDWTANFNVIDAAVAEGLVLVYTDWYPGTANANVPGAKGIVFCERCGNDGDINVVDGTAIVANGPFGVITNTNLDGGNASNHGYAEANTLPPDAKNILSAELANQSVLFSYAYGGGFVVYSTIPLGCYLVDNCLDPPRTAMNTILAPNMIAYATTLVTLQVPLRGISED